MKVLFTLLSCLAIQTTCLAQDNDLPKREAFKLRLAVDSANVYEADIEPTPYVLPNNTVQIYPGEKVYLEVELDGKTILNMKTVREVAKPDSTITISFIQQTEGGKHEGMMLRIENPFDKKLEYEAMIFLMKYNKWVRTTVVPVEKKLSSIELWPEIIVSIGLTGWSFK